MQPYLGLWHQNDSETKQVWNTDKMCKSMHENKKLREDFNNKNIKRKFVTYPLFGEKNPQF